jgi:hypothetical protein
VGVASPVDAWKLLGERLDLLTRPDTDVAADTISFASADTAYQ